MAKSWNEFRASDYYLNLTPEQRDAAHQQYFDEVVAPQIRANGDSVQSAYAQYMNETSTTPYYSNDFSSNKSVKQNLEAIGGQASDAWNGLVAYARKAGDESYNQSDLEQGKRYYNSNAGTYERMGAAVAASVIAPELLPEIGGISAVAEGSNLVRNIASVADVGLNNTEASLAYQLVDNQKVSPLQTGIDVGLGYGLEGALYGLGKSLRNPDIEAEAKIVTPGIMDLDIKDTFEKAIDDAEDANHAAYQIQTITNMMDEAKRAGLDVTAGDVLKEWANVAPEMHTDFENWINNTTPSQRAIRGSSNQYISPLQQVVKAITGKEIAQTASLEDMASMIEHLSSEDLSKIRDREMKAADKDIKNVYKEMRRLGYDGRYLDLFKTHRLVNDEMQKNPFNRVFAPDLNSIETDMLDNMGFSGKLQVASGIAGKLENLSIANRTARNIQFNRIASRYGDEVANKFADTLKNNITKADQASKTFRNTEKGNTLNSIAQHERNRSLNEALHYGVEDLEDLTKQISKIKTGKPIKPDSYLNPMYNAQVRKFVRLQEPSEIETARDLQQAAKTLKQVGKVATAKKPWNEGISSATVGYLVMDELTDKVVGTTIGSIAGAAVLGYGAKRAIDGAVNKALAEADRLLSGDVSMGNGLGSWIDNVDDTINQMKSDFEEYTGREPYNSEVKEMVQDAVRINLKKLRAKENSAKKVDKLMGHAPMPVFANLGSTLTQNNQSK